MTSHDTRTAPSVVVAAADARTAALARDALVRAGFACEVASDGLSARSKLADVEGELADSRRELELCKSALASTQRLAAVGTWQIDVATDTLSFSEEARRIFGWSERAPSSCKTADLLAFVREGQIVSVRDWFERACRTGECAPIEYRADVAAEEATGHAANDGTSSADSTDGSRADSREQIVRLHLDHVVRSDGKPSRVCGLVREVSEALDAPARSTSSADADDGTGLPTQRQFLERVARVIGNAQPPHDHVAVLYISLDVSHAMRDLPSARQACFQEMVERMKACIRDRDTLCHLHTRDREVSLAQASGEDFTILLPGLLRVQDAYKVTRRIQDAIARPVDVEGRTFSIHSSFGIAIFPTDSLDADSLVKAAETAMRAAREPGRDSVHFFTAAMNASAFERMTLETDLRDAIERRELLVYYQPKIEIATGNIVGMEALLRWQHPELGMVSPQQFIPIAEETGLIIPIGEYVLREACAQNKRWQDEGRRPIRMAVNLSTVQFRDPDMHKMVTRVLRATGLAPDHLELELTESVLLQRADTTVATLQSLKRMGVHLAIDDFGTGYSSLSYLKRFPIDSLKIDQSFIREVTTNPEDVAITTSIILMGRSLKLRVVAEGVESPSQLALLKVLECDEAQGYLFSRPAPADDIAKLFSTNFAFAQAR